jgi:integrase
MPKITKRTIDALPVGAVRQIIWDSEIKGFGVLALPGGTRSFIMRYRNAMGRERRLTLGRFGAITVKQARDEAKKALALVAKGEDPVADRREKRTAPTMNDLFDRYLADHVEAHNAVSTRTTVLQLLKNHLRPRLGAIKINALTRDDVHRFHSAMKATPRHANYAVAVLSKALALAEIWGYRPEHSNPVRGTARYAEVHRTRFLSGDEVKRLGAALGEAETEGLPWIVDETKPKAKHLPAQANRRTLMTWQVVSAFRLLLFTGARLSEILGLQWSHVDFEAGTIALPGRKGSQRKPHPASTHVLELLAVLPHIEGSPWVLPREGNPSRHVTKEVMEHAWHRLRCRAQIEDVRIHDLRHTVGTYAAQSGVSAFITRDLLRHATVAMTGRYANFDADPVRDVSNIVGGRIAAALEGRPPAEIIPLKRPS